MKHMEVSRLEVESELQLQAYARTTAIHDPSHICDLSFRLRQCQILNPLSKARMEPTSSGKLCQVLNLQSHNRNSGICIFNKVLRIYIHTEKRINIDLPNMREVHRLPLNIMLFGLH